MSLNVTSIDDTTPLFCSIESTRNVGHHVEYIVRVQRGLTQDDVWSVSRRYNDFVALDSDLKLSGISLSLPPKKVFGNTSREFIAERQQKLQEYVQEVLSDNTLANCICTKKFLTDDVYQTNLQESALQYISMLLRSEPQWEIIEPLPHIGYRLRKVYFLVKNSTISKERFLLSWCSYGPYCHMEEKELFALLKTLTTLQHPYLLPIKFASGHKNGALCIKPYLEGGSLRDKICKVKTVKSHYLKKYASRKSVSALSLTEIKSYGRQLLELMKYLHEKNFPLGHIHLGNIFIRGDCIQVSDIENFMLGVPPFHRALITNIRKYNTMEALDIYNFGHMIYEMTFGEPLQSNHLESIPSNCPSEIGLILNKILNMECIKAGLPTVGELLSLKFFADVTLKPIEKPNVKVPSKLKDCLRNSKSKFESQLEEDQKIISQVKKRSKVKAHHMSEGEKKKRLQTQKSAMLDNEDGLGGAAASTYSNGVSENSTKRSQRKPPAEICNGVKASPAPAAPAPPPPPPPPPLQSPPAPPPPPPPPSGNLPAAVAKPDNSRSALLSSISGFTKGSLKKATTVDKSGPRI